MEPDIGLGETLSSCIFCKLIAGEIPAQIVYEDDSILGFEDISPLAPIHYLFIPKQHVDSLVDCDTGMLALIFEAIKVVSKRDGILGFRTVINNGKEGGQEVFHLHAHMISGKKLSGDFS